MRTLQSGKKYSILLVISLLCLCCYTVACDEMPSSETPTSVSHRFPPPAPPHVAGPAAYLYIVLYDGGTVVDTSTTALVSTKVYSLKIYAVDADGYVATGYLGTVTPSFVAAGAGTVTFPLFSSYTFKAADAGVKLIANCVDFGAVDVYSITVSDGTLSDSITGANVTTALIGMQIESVDYLDAGAKKLTATVLDENGDPVPGTLVTFGSDDDGGLTALEAVTDANGEASTVYLGSSDGNPTTITAGTSSLVSSIQVE